jgi:hypothetical protein
MVSIPTCVILGTVFLFIEKLKAAVHRSLCHLLTSTSVLSLSFYGIYKNTNLIVTVFCPSPSMVSQFPHSKRERSSMTSEHLHKLLISTLGIILTLSSTIPTAFTYLCTHSFDTVLWIPTINPHLRFLCTCLFPHLELPLLGFPHTPLSVPSRLYLNVTCSVTTHIKQCIPAKSLFLPLNLPHFFSIALITIWHTWYSLVHLFILFLFLVQIKIWPKKLMIFFFATAIFPVRNKISCM